MPDVLFRRSKEVCNRRNMTFRELIIDAVENMLDEPTGKFALRDASAGYRADHGSSVGAERVNAAIDSLRDESSRA